jgi:hypothetical protein
MTDDIVTRLRHNTCFGIVDPLSAEAADKIECLHQAGDELRRMLAETPCDCLTNKCRCGRDGALNIWEEARCD